MKFNIRHILCGDICGASLSKSSVPGDVFVWHEIYLSGPTPADVTDEKFSVIREEHLTNYFLKKPAAKEIKHLANEKYRKLDACRDYKEVVLWFDACLFDQTHLIHQLDRLPNVLTRDTKLSLICIGEFPGFNRFLGLGQLIPEQMASLFETRHEVTANEIDLARQAWRAFRSDTPRDLEAIVADDCSVLPYLKVALIRFLQEYPSTLNGLSRLQQEILEAVKTGSSQLGEIFSTVSDAEELPYFGDITLWQEIDALASAATPVLQVEGPRQLADIAKVDSEPLPKGGLNKWQVSITAFGQKLLAGEADYVTTNPIDRWYGGVHLTGTEPMWRWDVHADRLVEVAGS